MPILKVSLWSGRSKEQKAELAQALTDTMVQVAKVPKEAVTIMFEELPKENWASNGILHSELHTDKPSKSLSLRSSAGLERSEGFERRP